MPRKAQKARKPEVSTEILYGDDIDPMLLAAVNSLCPPKLHPLTLPVARMICDPHGFEVGQMPAINLAVLDAVIVQFERRCEKLKKPVSAE